jgi:hypothetical protein
VEELRGTAAVRRIGVSIFIILFALVLYGLTPASSREDASSAASPKPSPSHTVRPRVTHTPRPHPTSTDPYPGGASQPIAPYGDSFFRVGDTMASPPVDRGTASVIWIALAMLGAGMVIRWFFIAARTRDEEPTR